MKKVKLVGIALIALLVASTVAFADETKVSLGLKMWANSWEEKVEPSGGTSQTFDMGSALMLGPSLSVRFPNRFFLGATYLTTVSEYESPDWFAVGDKMAFDRSDLDLMIGYMFNPQVGVFFGYKSMEAPATYTDAAGNTTSDIATWELTGPGFGVLGNIPIGESAALYGNLAIMFMKQKFEVPGFGSTPEIDTTGAALEVGVAFAFTDNVSANVGIKAQSFSGEDDFGDTTTDTFAGLTAGLTYTF